MFYCIKFAFFQCIREDDVKFIQQIYNFISKLLWDIPIQINSYHYTVCVVSCHTVTFDTAKPSFFFFFVIREAAINMLYLISFSPTFLSPEKCLQHVDMVYFQFFFDQDFKSTP